MSAPSTQSPWPAPTLAHPPHDAGASRDQRCETPARERSIPSPGRQVVSSVVDAARRLVDAGLRAEHAAAREEQRIRNELTDLPTGWFVLPPSDIGVLDGMIDNVEHIVIGPAGVLMIRVEHHLDAHVWVSEHTITINGLESNHLNESRFQARRISERLTDACGLAVTAQLVLVMIGATVQTVSRPAEVHVRAQHDLRDWLCVQPVRLEAETAAIIRHRVGRVALTPDYERGSRTTTGI